MLAILNTDFVTSIVFIFVTSVVGKLSRKVIDSSNISKRYRGLAYDSTVTFELCANCFELGVVIEKHGFLTYSILMLFLFNYWGSAWGTASASICTHLLSVFEKKSDIKSAFRGILFQALGASIVYQFYVKPIWSFGFRETHIEKLMQTDCFTHLQVSPIQGMVVEVIATFLFLTTLTTFGPKKHGFLTVPLLMVCIIYSAMGYSGGYFNPILASTVQFGCKGITLSDHVLVYWLGPTIGVFLYHNISNVLYPTKKTIKNN